jgi:protocatechuate 3,4-dioxygenase beta subunit
MLLAQVVLEPSKDNTLYESGTGNVSNGAGDFLFVGRTEQVSNSIRRGLAAFDVAGSVPAGSTITSVQLQLRVSRVRSSASESVGLHRMLADWGEGTSNSGGQEGTGATATTNDATWLHRFFNTQLWTNAGGDFVATASGTRTVQGIGSYTWSSSSGMVADVQQWLDDPASNFGWLLRGDESETGTAKRFDSSENTTKANRPTLTIDFTPPFQPITISGSVFDDRLGNGVRDGQDMPVLGSTVFLDSDGDFSLDAGEPTANTDESGNYSFSQLGAGTYRVRQAIPSGVTQTTANPVAIMAQSGVDVSNVAFGRFDLFEIAGHVLQDSNGDGTLQPDETAPLVGATVYIDTSGNDALDPNEVSVMTDGTGTYQFRDLGPGTYSVRLAAAAGSLQTTPTPAAVLGTSGTDVANVDFGSVLLGSIKGRVFEDSNGDGQRGAGETLLAGLTVFLDANRNGALDAGETTRTTRATGRYTFNGLRAADYRVVLVPPTGFVSVSADSTLQAGQAVTGLGLGTYRPATIRGRVFHDADGDGTADASEVGITGVTVFLDANSNGTFDEGERSRVTNSVGRVRFRNLAPGTYAVTQVVPTGFVQIAPADGAAVSLTLSSGSAGRADFADMAQPGGPGRSRRAVD